MVALNLFLQDVYGKQCIFKDRKISRSLVYSCPHFRREVIGVEVPRGIYTHICGIDLVRDSKTGEFCVLEDNVRTPSGISYVLENRLVMTRTLPDAFQACEVLPVHHYPLSWRGSCAAFRRAARDDAQIVLLTPGIYNSAYFEHSFLAQQMGIELVEGRDLIVDGGIVYMKTIHGLKRVDVIYRRVDDDFLDSLTFRADSILGVPGLMGAYRAGNVALANAVGNGVADDKAIYAYVPEFIRYYLGEEPILRSVETYICAKPKDLAYVLDHLPELVVKAVGESGGYGMLIGPAADDEKDRRVPRAHPGQSAQLHRPARGGALARAFLRPGDANGGRAPRGSAPLLPVRRKESDHRPRRTDARGAAARLAGGEFLAGRRQQGHLGAARGRLMLSRIAESLFWLARYIERAEDTARILDVNYHMLLEQSQQSYRLRWEPLIIMAGEENRFRQLYGEANAENVFEFLAFRQDNPSSIVQCIAKARENARTIRDRISREMWEDINGLYHSMSRFNPQDEIAAGPHRFCDEIKFGAHRFHGVTDATMPHDEGWQFLRIGWSLERAEMTARLVDVQYQNLLEEIPAGGRLRQSPVDGGAALGRRLRGVSPPISLPDRAGKSGRDADPASAASALDPLQR